MSCYLRWCDVCRRFMITTKVPETKGCMKCCVARNPYNGYRYLCGCVPGGVFLMQWYDPLNKFMLLKVGLPRCCMNSYVAYDVVSVMCANYKLQYCVRALASMLQQYTATFQSVPSVFEMLITDDQEYPYVCLSVQKGCVFMRTYIS